MSCLAVLIDHLFRSLFALPVPPSTSRSPLKNYDRATIYSGRPLPQGTILDLSQLLYAGTEDVADDGEHGYRGHTRRGEVRYGSTPVQRTLRTTESMDIEDVCSLAGAEGCDMALRRYRGRHGRGRAWISAHREDVRAVVGAEGCDMALRRYRGRRR